MSLMSFVAGPTDVASATAPGTPLDSSTVRNGGV